MSACIIVNGCSHVQTENIIVHFIQTNVSNLHTYTPVHSSVQVYSHSFDTPVNPHMLLLSVLCTARMYSMDVLTLCLPQECATTVAEHQEDYTLYEDN